MFKFMLTAILLISSAFGQEIPKHQISFGNNFNTAFSSKASSTKTDSDLGIDEFITAASELGITYSYRLSNHFQLGFLYSNERDEQRIEMDNGDKAETTERNSAIYLIGTYNFNQELNNSWFLGAAYGKEYYEEEVDSTSGDSDLEYDVTGLAFFVGKRFSLESWGIKNLTYAPQITFLNGEVGEDLEDAGVEELSQVIIDIVKFDLLF